MDVDVVALRDFGKGVHRQVDDSPFGGGAGMVVMVEPVDRALQPFGSATKVLLTPAGSRLDQSMLHRWAATEHVVLVCGRYEGVDERVAEHLVDEEVSLGDFVLAGGEVAALAIIEGVARLIPGVLGNPESAESESYGDGLLEEPHYTRPATYRGWEVPPILLSGDHRRVADWRQEQRETRTRDRRPDLWQAYRRRGRENST